MKKMKEDKRVSYLTYTFIFLIALIILIGVYFLSIGLNAEKPKISFENVTFKPDFALSLSRGCLTNVQGKILNLGGDAEDVKVECTLIGSGNDTIRGMKNLGAVEKNQKREFTMTINNNCPSPVDIECSASCSNCGNKIYS